MDIQFIGEKSTFLNWYCTKYTTKSESSYANDTFEAINSTKSLRSRLWNFAMRNLNNRECGALEACDTLLGISLYGTDPCTTIRWLDVNQIRSRRVKSRKEVESLDADSTDIFCKSIIDYYYPARPQELELLSLYNFAEWYDITKKKPVNNFYILEDGNKYPYYIKKRQRGYLVNHYKYNVEMQPEKYYYSLLLLFKPWRDLSEIKSEYSTYAEAFISICSQLPEAVSYHQKIANDQKYLKDIKENIENYLNEIVKSREENKQSNNETEFLAFEAGNAMQEFRNVLDKTDETNIDDLISGLNDDQKRVFDTITNTINSDSKCLRHYVSGEGGTGKSYLIKTIKCWVKKFLNKDVAIAAPTGIAAFNIDGLTIHRLFQLPVEHGYTPKYRQLSDIVLKTLRDELKNTILFIINEISMVSNITFMYIHLRLTEIFNTFDDGWFGKKHVLLLGDLLQLPPVHEEPAFIKMNKVKTEKYLESLGATNLWNDLFTYDELRINMRQKSDNSYRDLLFMIRLGIVTDNDIRTLNSRKINFKSTSCNGRLEELCNYIAKLPCDTVCLLPTCNLCNVLNTAMLERISSENIFLLAQDTIDCRQYLKKKALKVIATNDEDSTKTGGLSREIIVKIKAKIMLRRNIDVTLGLVNGTIGTITKCSRNIDNQDVNTLTITLSNGKQFNIERVSVKFEVMDKAYVIRRQFPLSLSYGITIHKSQGLSLNSAVIDAGNLIFSCGQIYVALSRVTSLEGLHLINFDPGSIKANELAIVEYNRLRNLYRQDIESINIQKNQYNKIKDRLWTVPVTGQEIYEESTNLESILLTSIKGFTNTDNVSCYANAVLQCIIHNAVIRKLLLKHDGTDVMKLLINDYIGEKNVLNCMSIRQFLGDPFSLNVQQDAAEFLKALCANITILKDIIEHDLSTTIHCKKYNYTNVNKQKNLIATLTIPIFLKQSIDMEYLMKHNFSHWTPIDGICENCKENNQLLIKYDICSFKEIIVIQLMLFSSNDKGISNIVKKCNIKGLPTAKISIGTNFYKVISAIFHYGNDLHEGHYTNMLRDHKSNKSKWFYVNDESISYKPWPRGSKDLYILFLEQCK